MLRGVGTETDLTAVGALLRYAKQRGRPLLRARPTAPRCKDTLGGGPAQSCSRTPSRAATTSSRCARPTPRPPSHRARPGPRPGAVRRRGDARRPHRRHRPALGAADRRWPSPVGPTRRASRPSSSGTTRSPGRSTPPRPAHADPDAPRPRRGLGRRGRPRRRAQRDAAQRRVHFQVAGQDELLAPYVDRYLDVGGHDLGGEGRAAGDRGAGATCSRGRSPTPGDPRHGERLAGRPPAQPGGQALRARGLRGPRAGAGRAGQGRRRPDPDAGWAPVDGRVRQSACSVRGRRACSASIDTPWFDATDQVAGGEGGLHRQRREPHLAVVELAAHLGARSRPRGPRAAGSTMTSTERSGAASAACSRSRERAGLALGRPDVDRELEAADRLGVADRLVDLVALRRR